MKTDQSPQSQLYRWGGLVEQGIRENESFLETFIQTANMTVRLQFNKAYPHIQFLFTQAFTAFQIVILDC